jgi:hypothetical protein
VTLRENALIEAVRLTFSQEGVAPNPISVSVK